MVNFLAFVCLYVYLLVCQPDCLNSSSSSNSNHLNLNLMEWDIGNGALYTVLFSDLFTHQKSANISTFANTL